MDMVQLLKKIYANPETVFASLHPEFTLYSPGQSLVAGKFLGAEGMKGHLGQMQALSNNTLRMELQNTFLANEAWGIVVSRITAQRDGKLLDTWGFGIWRFEDGKLIAHWEGVGDQAHWDSFWS